MLARMLQEEFEQELSQNPSNLTADEELAKRLQQEFDAQNVLSLMNNFNSRITRRARNNPTFLFLTYGNM